MALRKDPKDIPAEPRGTFPASMPYEDTTVEGSGEKAFCGGNIAKRVAKGGCGVQLSFFGGQPHLRLSSRWWLSPWMIGFHPCAFQYSAVR